MTCDNGLNYSIHKAMLKITDLCNEMYFLRNENEIKKILRERKNYERERN